MMRIIMGNLFLKERALELFQIILERPFLKFAAPKEMKAIKNKIKEKKFS